MTVLYFIVPLALLIAGGAVAAFVWTVRSGQLDDVETPPRRILLDDAPACAVRDHAAVRRLGMATSTTVPCEEELTSIVPSCKATRLCAIDMPIPAPPSFVEKNGS